MTREIQSDYEKLLTYVEEYGTRDLLSKSGYKEKLKQLHSYYISYGTISIAIVNSLDLTKQSLLVLYIQEVKSDIMGAIFAWINGVYKVSNLSLRSAIENAIRSIAAQDDITILEEDSVRALFARSKNSGAYGVPEVKIGIDALVQIYGDLCEDVHTASEKRMARLNSLNEFPKFTVADSNRNAGYIIRVLKLLVIIHTAYHNNIYQKLHHRDKEKVSNALSKTEKRLVNLEIPARSSTI